MRQSSIQAGPAIILASIRSPQPALDEGDFYEDWSHPAELEFGHAHPEFPMAVLPPARSEALLSDSMLVPAGFAEARDY